MNMKLFSVVTLRALSLLLSLQGRAREAAGLDKLIDGIEAGIEVDAHMAKVAEALKAGTEADWDDITGRIKSEVDAFLDREPEAEVEGKSE